MTLDHTPTEAHADAAVAALDATVAELRSDVTRLRSMMSAMVDQPAAHGGTGVHVEPDSDDLTQPLALSEAVEVAPVLVAARGRRAMIKAAGAAVVGAAAGAALLPNSAAANDPNDITLGATKTTPGYTIAGFALPQPNQPTDHGFQFAAGSTNSTTDTRVQGHSVLSASTSDQRMPNAIRAVTTANGAAISASGTYAGIRASASNNNFGIGGDFRGGYAGITAVGNEVGASISGSQGAISLNATVGVTHTTDDAPSGGVLDVTADGTNPSFDPKTLWWAPQRDGKWMKLAGPGTAGAFHPVTPFRVYDSRAPQPSPGQLQPGTSRLIDVSTARNVDTGAPNTVDAIPAGATAIAYNLTITNTGPRGFLYIADGDATTVAGSTINWSEPGTTIANASTVKLDADRGIRAFCTATAADFIIDITGYYR